MLVAPNAASMSSMEQRAASRVEAVPSATGSPAQRMSPLIPHCPETPPSSPVLGAVRNLTAEFNGLLGNQPYFLQSRDVPFPTLLLPGEATPHDDQGRRTMYP